MEEIKCSKCGTVKTSKVCKTCKALTDRLYYIKNRDRLIAKQKLYRLEHPDVLQRYRLEKADAIKLTYKRYCEENKAVISEYRKEYQENNKVAILEWKKNHRSENAAEIKEYMVEYRRNNKDKFTEYCNNRRISKHSRKVAFGNKFFISEIYELRRLREASLNKKLAVDHIVPITSWLVCGLHYERNLQIISREYNSAKGNRYWPDMPDYSQQDKHELKYYKWLSENANNLDTNLKLC